MFKFQGNEASIRVEGNKAQSVIDHFKGWIPIVTAELKQKLENEERRRVLEEKSRLKQEAAALEARQKVMQGLRF